jgi:hypothetical protein
MCCDTHESINKVYFPPRGLLARAERRLETFFTGAVVPPGRNRRALHSEGLCRGSLFGGVWRKSYRRGFPKLCAPGWRVQNVKLTPANHRLRDQRSDQQRAAPIFAVFLAAQQPNGFANVP